MKTKYLRAVLPVLALAALCGCGTPYNYSPYVGQQQNWTTGPGGYVKVVNKAMLYGPGQLPDRPYFILGSVTTDSEDNLANAVHDQHADAALISSESTVRNGSVAVASGGFFWSEPLRKTVVTANLIKFKP